MTINRHFYIARHSPGDVNTAHTPRGTQISRQTWIQIPELAKSAPPDFCQGDDLDIFETIPYDIHFIYKNPDVIPGISQADVPPHVLLCTCGFSAGLVWGPQVPESYQYKLACYYDCTTGFKGLHATRQINVKDFELGKYAGKKQKIDPE